MASTLANPFRRLSAIVLLTSTSAVGCTVSTGGQIPNGYNDPDVVYFDPGPQFPLRGGTEAAKPKEVDVKAQRAEQQ
ncbi:MAG: hypothetical protein K8T25_00485 [Planctomycetia bacterium]|nr:hypothetical protein [Planctomycetia bacterium]